jgi:KUP system potassium uptake protein
LPSSPDNILGVLSLIFWSLIIVITIKYLVFVMRADNHGEGGILALTALIGAKSRVLLAGTQRWTLVMLGLFGTALLYGDGMITPAISVLSAVEGLEIVTPFFEPYVLPITIAILVALFMFQSRGTERVGRVFGPVMVLWFVVLGLLGLSWIVRQPSVLAAVNPYYAFAFFWENGWRGFLVLGSVFLVVTGGEALYADMGHFGREPIRRAWFVMVLPALLLNYFGQGALLLQHPEAVENPFYQMAPAWALLPLVLLATLATVIASQALITGAFSLTMQAVQLGYLPRVAIAHTSAAEIGQIYIASINWVLMVACVALVLAFRSSSNLAAAYGVAVTTTMVITTLLLFRVERRRWHWSPWVAAVSLGRLSDHRLRLLGRQPAQDSCGRLVPPGDRRGGLHRHDHLAPRAHTPGAAAAAGHPAAPATLSSGWISEAGASAWRGDLHVQRSGWHPAGVGARICATTKCSTSRSSCSR